jgi:hypothetical protein
MSYLIKKTFSSMTVLKYGEKERKILDDVVAFDIIHCIELTFSSLNEYNNSKHIKELKLFLPDYFTILNIKNKLKDKLIE